MFVWVFIIFSSFPCPTLWLWEGETMVVLFIHDNDDYFLSWNYFWVREGLTVLPNRRTCELNPEIVNTHIAFSLLFKDCWNVLWYMTTCKQQMRVYRTQWICFCRVWPVGVGWLDHPAQYFAFSAILLSWECLLVLLLKAAVSVTIKVLLCSHGRFLLCGLALPNCPSSNKTSSGIICDSLTYVSPFLFSTSCGC